MTTAYWREQERQVQDGGRLTHEDSAALFDYLNDLKKVAHLLINDPTDLHRWFTLKTVLDAGPKSPED